VRAVLEGVILGVIVLAAVYGATLWLMGRHQDVLYGRFVTPGTPGRPFLPQDHSTPPEPRDVPRPARSAPASSLPRPVARPILAATPASAGHIPNAVTSRRQAAPSPPMDAAHSRDDLLASLLATIKRDLDDATRTST
jgi:hypothetical protein